MNRSILSVAFCVVALAVAAPGVRAQPATPSGTASYSPSLDVSLYGRLYPGITVAGTQGATDPASVPATLVGTGTGGDLKGRSSVDSAGSRVGARVREDFGGGAKLIAQIETIADIDRGTGIWGSGDSFLGLDGSMGTVRLGRMVTVYRAYGDRFDFLGVAEGNFVSASSILARPGFGIAPESVHFHQRTSNAVVYDSPRFGAWEFALQYAKAEDDAYLSDGRPNIGSAGLRFSSGAVTLALAYELHRDVFGASRTQTAGLPRNDLIYGTSSRDAATRLSAEVRAGAHRLTGDVSHTRYSERGGVAGSFSEYRNWAYALGWEARWRGPWRTAVQFAAATAGKCALEGGLACNTAGLGGRLVSLGTGYALSRRTGVFLLLARLDNSASATYNNLLNAQPSRGAQITQAAAGVSHSF